VVSRRVAGRRGDAFAGYRARLVETLRAKGIRNLAVLRAFAETPRHLFVPEALRRRAYDDIALPIGDGQTISQPFTQARYLEALGLRGAERVLEIGTGSGYQTALLCALAAQVFSVERVQHLAIQAQQVLRAAGVTKASVLAPGGRLLIPLGDRGAQTLTLVERREGEIRRTPLGDTRFVPLLGEHGFDA
jgi:protein-L-isoaspartate(D-aspartate) O-methyltransferase